MIRSGVVVIDKARGPTSHDVVARVRRVLGTRAVGHAGTLDPMATGVLVIAVGQATKLVLYLTAHDKAYAATLRLGVTTRSLDADGEITESPGIDEALRRALSAVAAGGRDERIDRALEVERARVEQIPPIVSAIKVDGEASHARARRGAEVALAPRAVVVRALRVMGARVDPPELDVEIVSGKGYYVRALARDLAASLGSVSHLVALRRTRSGPFAIDEAVAVDERLGEHLLSPSQAAARALPTAALSEEGVVRARHGKRLSLADFVAPPCDGPSAWLDALGQLVAVGELVDGEGRVLRGFSPEEASP